MNSIAIWWNLKDEVSDTPAVSIDTNIWLTKNEKNNYIEFGLKITNYESIKDICFFLPFVFDQSKFNDKITKLADSTSLTNALFNDNMRVKRGDGKLHKVEYPSVADQTEAFYYYQLNENDDISIAPFKNNENNTGSILSIKLDNIPAKFDKKPITSGSTIYLRFRINKLDNIFKSINENNFIVDGLFKKIGFVEFNLNNIRKLPSDIASKFSSDMKITKINLFLMTDSFSNFLFESKPLKSSRILENHIWDQYLDKLNDINTDKIIAYHWQEKDILKEFSVFAKVAYANRNILIFGCMLILLLILGTIGSVIGNWVTTKVFNNFTTNKTSEEIHEKLSMPKTK